jgi:D-lactate dehydrogenase (cytochrome)
MSMAHDQITPPPRSAESIKTAIAVLQQRFGDRVQTGQAIREQHGHTLTWIQNEPPDAVVWPNNQDEVVEIVRIAGEHNCPIIPFGAGTSLEGHVNAPEGGISLDFQNMKEVIAVNHEDLDVVIQPGISRTELNDYLRDTGLFFPIDPGADNATLGGMAATRASGTNAVLYGTMRENVLNVTAVMADGSVVKTGGRARKSSAGYDLTRLLVGSEGTLGIITELTVRVYGVPEMILAAVCPFKTIEGACNSVIQSIQLGLGVARMELLDPMQIRAVNFHSKTEFEECPTLFLEFHGTPVSARDQVDNFNEIAKEEGAIRFDWAEREEDRSKLWKARHDAYWSVRSTWPGMDTLASDVCVPVSRLAECVTETARDIEEHGLIAPIVGHVGDGNFHTQPVFDPADPAAKQKVEEFLSRLSKRAIAMEGTCTGEHGVGQGKRKYLKAEHGSGLNVMQQIKSTLDPQNLLNPGKIISL